MTKNKVLLLAGAAAASLLVPVLVGVLTAGTATAQSGSAAQPAPADAGSSPMPLVRVPPEYPPAALARGLEGWVLLQFTISTIGTVKDATVVDANPKGVFDDAALKAIARWRYNPRVEGGVPVERPGIQTRIMFELAEGEWAL